MARMNMVIKRFDTKIEAKLLTKLNKLFVSDGNAYSEEEALKDGNLAIMDPANVCMIIALKEESIRLLSRFSNKDQKQKIHTLDYKQKESSLSIENTSKYSMEYIIPIMSILNVNFETVKISMKKDYPMTLETDYFKVILAPRVDDD